MSRSLDLQIPRFPDFQTPPAPPDPDKISDPNLTPLPTHPGIKYVVRTLAAMTIQLLENGPIFVEALHV